MKKTLYIIILTFGFILHLSAQTATTNWSLWVGSHYSSFDKYVPKVAEFQSNEDGFLPELRFSVAHQVDKNQLAAKGWYYDPERMSFQLDGRLGTTVNADFSYQSYFRQLPLDFLENLSAVENGPTKPGGKMLTHELINPDETLGYKREEIEANLEFTVPGLEQLKLFASNRMIMEEGMDQSVQNTHCSQCHAVSRPMKVNSTSNTLSGGFEADLDIAKLSYQISMRTFESDADPITAFYDTIRHPRLQNPGLYSVFGRRVLYGGENVTVSGLPETEKMSHKITAKANIGKGRLLLQYINLSAENTNIMNESFNVNGTFPNEINYSGDLNLTGNTYSLNYTTPLFPKTRLIASGRYSRYENDPIGVDGPPFGAKSDSGFIFIDKDYIRYSALTRTDMKASLKFIYQPTRKYRLSLLGGYGMRERDDYPFNGANDKTTRLRLETAVRYRPSTALTGRLRYGIESIDNPFRPYDLMFESRGRGVLEVITGTANGGPDQAKHIFYFQRDDLRFGNVTMLPTIAHRIGFDLNYQATETLKLNTGLNVNLGSNEDAPQLDFTQQMIQPKLGLTYTPTGDFMFYGNYSYVMRSQTGLAAVALMDG